MKKLLWWPFLLLFLTGSSVALASPTPRPTIATACAGIDGFADQYLAAYSALMLRVSDHPDLYDAEAVALTAEQIRIIRDDFAQLAADLEQLTPPSGLYQQWSAEIAYWRMFAAYAEAGAAVDMTYASNAHGMTISVLANSVVTATQFATANCPVWQQTVDTVKAMTAAD